MKRILLAVCGAATAATLVSAQTPPSSTSPTNPQTPQTQAPQTMDRDRDRDMQGSRSGKNVTVTGCVRSGASSGDYVLAKASDDMSSTGSSASTGTTGSTSSATGAQSGTAGTSGTLSGAAAWTLGDKFKLSGKTSDLSQHLNHKVEITGELGSHGMGSPSSYGSPSTGSTSSATGSTGSTAGSSTTGASSDTNIPEIKVKSVRMISETCS